MKLKQRSQVSGPGRGPTMKFVYSAVSSVMLRLASAGGSLLECTQFVDGYSWGPVALADVKIAGESAGSVPVQVIGDPGFTTVPTNCSGTGKAEDTVAAFGANGLLGVGVFAQDCGAGCVSNAANMVAPSAATVTRCECFLKKFVNSDRISSSSSTMRRWGIGVILRR